MDTDPSSSPVYFWRDSEPEGGYLSQWYPCAFSDDADPSIVYPTAEHYMMYQKALLFSDRAVGAQILAASHPRQVKALGRKVSNFDEKVWHAHREEIVRKGNWLKFTRPLDVNDGKWIITPPPPPSPAEGQVDSSEGKGDGVSKAEGEGVSLKELLLRTGDRELVEASPMDRIWGIGFGAARAGTVGRERWGLNLLGKALMAVRGELRRMEEGGRQEGGRGQEKEESKGGEEEGDRV
ncbi:hypothetical protein VTI74DRAFT_4890 [Chaetomium olivicolor]